MVVLRSRGDEPSKHEALMSGNLGSRILPFPQRHLSEKYIDVYVLCRALVTRQGSLVPLTTSRGRIRGVLCEVALRQQQAVVDTTTSSKPCF